MPGFLGGTIAEAAAAVQLPFTDVATAEPGSPEDFENVFGGKKARHVRSKIEDAYTRRFWQYVKHPCLQEKVPSAIAENVKQAECKRLLEVGGHHAHVGPLLKDSLQQYVVVNPYDDPVLKPGKEAHVPMSLKEYVDAKSFRKRFRLPEDFDCVVLNGIRGTTFQSPEDVEALKDVAKGARLVILESAEDHKALPEDAAESGGPEHSNALEKGVNALQDIGYRDVGPEKGSAVMDCGEEVDCDDPGFSKGCQPGVLKRNIVQLEKPSWGSLFKSYKNQNGKPFIQNVVCDNDGRCFGKVKGRGKIVLQCDYLTKTCVVESVDGKPPASPIVSNFEDAAQLSWTNGNTWTASQGHPGVLCQNYDDGEGTSVTDITCDTKGRCGGMMQGKKLKLLCDFSSQTCVSESYDGKPLPTRSVATWHDVSKLNWSSGKQWKCTKMLPSEERIPKPAPFEPGDEEEPAQTLVPEKKPAGGDKGKPVDPCAALGTPEEVQACRRADCKPVKHHPHKTEKVPHYTGDFKDVLLGSTDPYGEILHNGLTLKANNFTKVDHFVSNVGSFTTAANLLLNVKPKEIHFFDESHEAVAWGKMLSELIQSSASPQDFVGRLFARDVATFESGVGAKLSAENQEAFLAAPIDEKLRASAKAALSLESRKVYHDVMQAYQEGTKVHDDWNVNGPLLPCEDRRKFSRYTRSRLGPTPAQPCEGSASFLYGEGFLASQKSFDTVKKKLSDIPTTWAAGVHIGDVDPDFVVPETKGSTTIINVGDLFTNGRDELYTELPTPYDWNMLHLKAWKEYVGRDGLVLLQTGTPSKAGLVQELLGEQPDPSSVPYRRPAWKSWSAWDSSAFLPPSVCVTGKKLHAEDCRAPGSRAPPASVLQSKAHMESGGDEEAQQAKAASEAPASPRGPIERKPSAGPPNRLATDDRQGRAMNVEGFGTAVQGGQAAGSNSEGGKSSGSPPNSKATTWAEAVADLVGQARDAAHSLVGSTPVKTPAAGSTAATAGGQAPQQSSQGTASAAAAKAAGKVDSSAPSSQVVASGGGAVGKADSQQAEAAATSAGDAASLAQQVQGAGAASPASPPAAESAGIKVGADAGSTAGKPASQGRAEAGGRGASHPQPAAAASDSQSDGKGVESSLPAAANAATEGGAASSEPSGGDAAEEDDNLTGEQEEQADYLKVPSEIVFSLPPGMAAAMQRGVDADCIVAATLAEQARLRQEERLCMPAHARKPKKHNWVSTHRELQLVGFLF
eukprot:TRINITY_DN23820_c0_g1_i1.p1 TRINITY_DN23820_c0_g1~~TRINITY_DN23820_c0_g1_i1.p1  ORF type:complete len:1246 (+),score=277.85 TRINITY_DN23820_c0_g1_i1:183-3920(+)